MNNLKRFVAGALVAGMITGGVAATESNADAAGDDMAAIVLSYSLPGVGEWYNAGFSGGFPLVECILGNICICIRLASVLDAAAGRTDDGIRFDFWASPNG
jgi:hypothetical protein